MPKKRNSLLFPQDTSPYTSSPNNDPRSCLFGLSDSSSTQEAPPAPASTRRHTTFQSKSGISRDPSALIDSLGGNLHQMTSKQIMRLINVKYHGDFTLLVKQLSVDLARKESELILLRQEKFSTEQKLMRICNEYGNLSTLEIHQKMNEMEDPELASSGQNQVNETLRGMLNTAIGESIESSTNVGNDPNRRKRTPSEKDHPSTHIDSEQSSEKPDSVSGASEDSGRSWLRNWFHSSEDLTSESPLSSMSHSTLLSGPSKRPHSRSSPIRPTKEEKEPVEMDDIHLRRSQSASVGPEEVHIDKYGFFTDLDRKSSSSTPAPKESNEPSPDSISLNENESLQHSKSSLKNGKEILEGFGVIIGNKDKHQTISHLKEIGKNHDIHNYRVEQQWETLYNEIQKDFIMFNKDEGGDIGLDMMIGVKGLNLVRLDNWNDKRKRRKTHHYSKLVHLINQYGISPKHRIRLWLQLSGAKNLRVNGVYQELLNSVNAAAKDSIISNNIRQIDLDLHRTLPRNYYFNNLIELKPGPNYYKLQRILYAFVGHKPEIGYLQGMNKIVGNLLLLLVKENGSESHDGFDEEDVFWIFVGLIEEILPKYPVEVKRADLSSDLHSRFNSALSFIDQSFYNSLLSIRVDQLVMKLVYLKKTSPQLATHFKNLGLEIELITMNWWLTLFIDLRFLDLDSWFKVFDNLLIGGSTIDESLEEAEYSFQSGVDIQRAIKLITLSLSILKCLEPHLLTMNDKDTIYEYLNSNNTEATESTSTVKFGDIMKYNQEFTKNIKSCDLNMYRQKIIKG